MGNKSQKTKYGEFRVFVEWQRRGKYRIRREFVPSVCAWLLMIGRRYERAAEGMESKLVTASVPGLAESAAVLRTCIENIQRLLNMLPDNFSQEDWQLAVHEVCTLFKITPNSEPMAEIPDGAIEHLITELPDGGHEDGSGDDVHDSSGDGQGGTVAPDVQRNLRSDVPDPPRVPEVPAAPGSGPKRRDERRKKGTRGKRPRS